MKGHCVAKLTGVVFFLLAMLIFSAQPSWGAYPDKRILLVCPWNPGGSIDMSLRPLVEAASRAIGQPITLEFRTGGTTALALGFLKGQKPDGYTIGMTSSTSSLVNQHMNKVAYDLLKDFDLIMQYADNP